MTPSISSFKLIGLSDTRFTSRTLCTNSSFKLSIWFAFDMRSGKELLILGLLCVLRKGLCECDQGLYSVGRQCVDMNECKEFPDVCGKYTNCTNTNGSYYCQCLPGFTNANGNVHFTGLDGQCQDNNECTDNHYGDNICGHGGNCSNLIGSFECTCHFGFASNRSRQELCVDINECNEAEMKTENICGVQGTCNNVEGSYWCKCPQGYTNYGMERTPCSKLDCDDFKAENMPATSLGGLADMLLLMRNSCLALSNPSLIGEGKADREALLQQLLTATEAILSSGPLNSSEDVSRLLVTVENSIMLIGQHLKGSSKKSETTKTEIAVQRGNTQPFGPIHLTAGNASLDTDWTTAAGTGPYTGFALAALLIYKNLELSGNHSFEELTEYEKDGVHPSFQVSSRVASVVVSNPSTQNLSHPVNITLRHLQDTEESPEVKYICVYWSERGTWSTDGCHQKHSNITHTLCSCDHLTSFAVLMARYPMKHTFGLLLVTKIGLTLSLLCLMLCILTFKFCHSIQGTRNTIHLHLCVCLFMADLFFLAGVSQTQPVGGCRFIAVMLHFFFLGVFTWMLLEGVQLYRMVILVFNATIRPLHLFLVGYGTPLFIVVISVIIRANGYGTDKHCWLSLEDGLIWSFFGPVCFIILLNIFFFIVTVWRLAQKFSSLNPDLTKLYKIKAFTVTAVAQMCILGLMWVFGAFLFEEGSTLVAYVFTILNSLQGVLVFIMHCLLSKQVREEYANFLVYITTPQKKRYSDFSSTNPSSNQSQVSRSGQHTGESQI
ncbi:adhesion G protein-coupled receptor E5-like [Brachionichthys hirsutus]|uniref:adhesion G protein-coupled receptor E5-like n=1 Tax=Brachionichthys hirsutus TaxID=412623 RepID=UPI0036048809